MYRIGDWLFVPGKGWVDTGASAAGAGCVIPLLILMFITCGMAYFVRPTYEYKQTEYQSGDGWKGEISLKYQKWIGSDSIFGEIWYYDSKYVGEGVFSTGHHESYQVDSRFRGILVGEDAYIQLKKPEIKYSEDYSYERNMPDRIHLTLTKNEVIFRDGVMTSEIKAPGEQATWSFLFSQFDWE